MCIRDRDYAGPVLIRHGGQRSKSTAKAYIALFICMCTKAIHLELVSDLTSDAFIAALKRFIARRGIPTQLFSDNGTNFRRASSTLHDLYRLFKSKGYEQTTQEFISSQDIKWSFIRPSAPHFGGLWESGVKSCLLYTSLSGHGRLLLNVITSATFRFPLTNPCIRCCFT